MSFVNVRSLEAASHELSRSGGECTILAGGTDVMIQARRGELKPVNWLFIGGIGELNAVEDVDGRYRIGALVSHRAISRHPQLTVRLPALSRASSTVGGWQTQEAGTIGGNICNASPAADSLPPLLVADANVTLSSASGERTLALDDFVLGRRMVDRRPDELLTAVEATALPEGAAEVYLKVGARSAMEVAIVGLAVRIQFGTDGRVAEARVAVGSVGPRAFRVPGVEAALIGTPADPSALRAAGDALVEAATPIDDVRATADYRRRILAPLLERAVNHCRERATVAAVDTNRWKGGP